MELIISLSEEFKQDLSLIGFSNDNLTDKLITVIKAIWDVIKKDKKKFQTLTIKEPF